MPPLNYGNEGTGKRCFLLERKTPFDHTPGPFSIASKDRSISRCPMARPVETRNFGECQLNSTSHATGKMELTPKYRIHDCEQTRTAQCRVFISKRELDDNYNEVRRRCYEGHTVTQIS